jgi:hypothetical protein
MANPVLTPADGEHDANVVNFRWRFSVGATGALTAKKSKGLKGSPVRNSAGSYTFTLGGTYPGGMLSYAKPGIIGAYTTADGTEGTVTVDNSATTTPTITLVFYAVNTQTATEVKNGVDFVFTFALQNGIV